MVLRPAAIVAGVLFLAGALAASASEPTALNPPRCSELSYVDSLALHPDAFGTLHMELAIDDYRGWVKNKIRAYVSLAKRGHARKRKRTHGTMTFHTRTGIACTVRVKFRAHGDLEDHYPSDIRDEPSLNVHLIDGHVFGITKFILFRPDTRNGENEVFAATTLSQLGFLSPRTAMGTLRVTGEAKPAVRVIFQEKIVKEFLEANHLREGPIIEGDERFAFGQKYAYLKRGAALARLSNFKWAAKGPSSMRIADAALSRMNRLLVRYDKSHATMLGSNMVDIVELAARLDAGKDGVHFIGYPEFEALVFAMGGTHGFSQDDRRAVYDPLTGVFAPIYYDGGTSILTRPEDALDRNITLTARNAVPRARDRLAALDQGELKRRLAVRGVSLSEIEVETAIGHMNRRLREFETTDQVEPVEVRTRTLYRNDDNRLSYVFAPDASGRLEMCLGSLQNCRRTMATAKLMAKLIAQSWSDDQGRPAIYFAFPKSELTGPFSGFVDRAIADLRQVSMSVAGVRLDLFGEITADVDSQRRTLRLVRSGASGRAVISGGRMRDWSVRLDDTSGHVKNVGSGEQNFDALGLTGCLSLIDVELSGIELSVNDATCEDGINFVRVSGLVRKVAVANAAFDAVDADFSRLEFAEVIVDRAGNDCIDLSFGVYVGERLVLNGCGDKAVSVGESSTASLGSVVARDSAIGLAAKDFGAIEVAHGRFERVAKCYDLYNKKQEFSGGSLKVGPGTLDCGGAGGTVGPTSRLVVASHF